MQTNVCKEKKFVKKVQMFKLGRFKCADTNEEFLEPQKALESLNKGFQVVAAGILEEYKGKKNVSITTAPIISIDIFKKCFKLETGRFIYKVNM